MSTETNAVKEFDSQKHVALVYDHHGIVKFRFESNSPSEVNSLAADAYRLCVETATIVGDDPNAPLFETYTRDRDVRKLVEEAYAKGLAEGKEGQ